MRRRGCPTCCTCRPSVAEARGARVRFAQQVALNEPDGEVICEGVAEVACKDAERGSAAAATNGTHE